MEVVEREDIGPEIKPFEATPSTESTKTTPPSGGVLVPLPEELEAPGATVSSDGGVSVNVVEPEKAAACESRTEFDFSTTSISNP